MATFVFQKQQMTAGESRISESFTVPAGLTVARAELDMNAAEMRDSATHVRAILEFSDPLTGQFRHLASTTLEGRPENTIQTAPFIEIGATTLAQLVGRDVRCRIEALSDGRYGATLTWN